MGRALLWKEWRELRSLRWMGVALGALLPFVLLAAAEGSTRGWLPFGRVSSYSARTIFVDVLAPMMAFGLWPLIALLCAAQAFAGNRAAGTEEFLLARPVARGRIWSSRMVAICGTSIAVSVLTSGIWWLLVSVAAGPGSPEWGRPLVQLLLGGTVIALTAIVAGATASSFLPSPIAGVLLGLILGGAPFVLAGMLGGYFHFAAYRGVPIGFVVPWIVLVGYALASYRMLCRGEPAGRGRWLRGATVLGLSLLGVPAVFAVAAPAAMRWDAGRMAHGVVVFPSPSGGAALAYNRGTSSGWLIDVGDGAKLRFLEPPIDEPVWSADGSRLAVGSGAGLLGSVGHAGTRALIYDRRGDTVAERTLASNLWFYDGRWAGNRLVVCYESYGYAGEESSGLLIIDTESGVIHRQPLNRQYGDWGLIGPTEDGRLFVARAVRDSTAGADPEVEWEVDTEERRETPYSLHEVDVEHFRIAPEAILRDAGSPRYASSRLSPSGRYWRIDRAARLSEERLVLDLDTGRELELEPLGGQATWLRGDHLVWVRHDGDGTSLRLARPGETPRTIRAWDRGAAALVAAPDRRRVLVAVGDPLLPESFVYDVVDDSWTALPHWPDETQDRDRLFVRTWAGPATLARAGSGYLALEPLERPGVVIEVLGRD